MARLLVHIDTYTTCIAPPEEVVEEEEESLSSSITRIYVVRTAIGL